MPLHDDYLASLDTDEGDIRQLLQHAGVAQADIHVEKYSSKLEQRTSQQRTFYVSTEEEEEARRSNRKNDGTCIYAIGSLTKLLIAILISIIVDRLSYSDAPEDEPYRRLRKLHPDPWDTPFTVLFNNFSSMKISSLPKDPTLRHVLLHFNSLPPMNSILLAPDGTSLMSVKEFLEVVPRLIQEGDNIEYSNGNYILIGLLIQAIAPKNETLQTLMEKYIFRPLEMNHTYMSRCDLDNRPCARPHVVSTEGRRELIDNPGYREDDVVSAALAAHSCTKDIAILLRTLQCSLNGEESKFEKDLVVRLLRPDGRIDNTGSDRQTLCGTYTTLDTSTPGSKSINRLITPTKVCSTYRLGMRPGKEVSHVPAYYMAGAVYGYASCFYFIPKHSTFVIVLTNTSRRIDASGHISRLILQDIFDLERTHRQLASLTVKLLDKNLDLQKSDVKAKVDILQMSLRAAEEGHKLQKDWEMVDTQGDVAGTLAIQLEGSYCNELTLQSIVIRAQGGRLIVNIMGDAGISRDIGLHRTGDLTFRIYPLHRDGFTIDRYESQGWKDLSFNIDVKEGSEGNRTVVGIERQGDLLPSTSIYKRKL